MIDVIPIPALWLAWLVYWNVAAIGTKPVRRRQPRAARLLDLASLFAAGGLIAIGPALRSGRFQWLYIRFLPRAEIGYWAGVLVVALGLGFAVWARRVLGRDWSGTVTLKEGHELVRSGPYRFVRHPIYTGILTGFAGSAIALGELRGVLALLFVLASFLRRIVVEERWMMETFGDAYADYRARTKALIPFLL